MGCVNHQVSEIEKSLDDTLKSLEETNASLHCLNEMMKLKVETIHIETAKMFHKPVDKTTKEERKAYLELFIANCKENFKGSKHD